MGVSVEHFSTNAFTLKDQESVEFIQRLVYLLNDESNLVCGYAASDFYAEMYDYSGDGLTFKIHTGGYCDGGPQLKYGVVYQDHNSDNDDQYDYDNYIDLWDEIHARLKEKTYLVVKRHTSEKSGLYFGVVAYKQGGGSVHRNCYELEREMLKELGFEE